MTKQAAISNNRTDAKAKNMPVKVGTKSTSPPFVIAKTKKTTTSVSVAKGEKKKHASSRPVPKGWPVSSHLTYPAPSCHGVRATNGCSISDLVSDSPSKNYLTPGNLLRQSCNGSDVYLRKRAVQSMSVMYPITTAAGGDNNKGGPTRFLIIFPGRMSLKPPPPSSSNNTAARRTSKDNDDDDENREQQGEQTKRLNELDKTDSKKNPFTPTHPPHLLGKLVVSTTALANGGQCSTELRIPLPSSSSDSMHNDQHQQKQEQMIVMSGRAIPLSGKYMALSFKRTGGSKDSAPSGSGGGDGVAGRNNKKKGTGSIICKDVFRSVIVLGESRIVEGDGLAVSLEGLTQIRSKKDEEGEEDYPLEMLHYGGSDRTLDGGGKCNVGIHGGRRRIDGGIPIATKSFPRKESISSKGSDDMDSDVSDVMNVEEDNGDSSDTDEFVPISARKRKSTGGCKKRGASGDASSDKDDENMTPARKRTPRRSVEISKISYVDKSSDEEELDSSDSDEGGNEPRSKITDKPAVKRSASTIQVTKTNKSYKSAAKAGSKVKKSSPVLCVDSSEEENDTETQIKQSGMRQFKKSTVNNGGSSRTARQQGSGAAKRVNFSPSNNDIINIDCGEDEAEKGESNVIAYDARRRPSTLSTNQSPLKLSPISRGRRKDKKSPTKSTTTTKDTDLSLDDDPFSFL